MDKQALTHALTTWLPQPVAEDVAGQVMQVAEDVRYLDAAEFRAWGDRILSADRLGRTAARLGVAVAPLPLHPAQAAAILEQIALAVRWPG